MQFDRDAFARRVDELRSIELGSDHASAALRAQAAVALHHAYGSTETLMVRVARHPEGDLPSGADWHPALLQAMGLELQGVGPLVFFPASIRALQHLVGFRRFFRHAYASDDAGRLAVLREDAIGAAPAILADLG